MNLGWHHHGPHYYYYALVLNMMMASLTAATFNKWMGWEHELKALLVKPNKNSLKRPLLSECFLESFPYGENKVRAIKEAIVARLGEIELETIILDPKNIVKIRAKHFNENQNMILSGFSAQLFWPLAMEKWNKRGPEKHIEEWRKEAQKADNWIKANCIKDAKTEASGSKSIFHGLAMKFGESGDAVKKTMAELFAEYMGHFYQRYNKNEGQEEEEEEERGEWAKMEAEFHRMLRGCICDKLTDAQNNVWVHGNWY